jgi:hypothetical protein
LPALAGVWLVAALLLYPCSALAQAPDTNWNLTGSDAQQTVVDCVGTSYYPSADSGNGCQLYASDVYENWDTSTSGPGDTDIEFFRTGADADFFYFEFETRESWDYDGSGTGRTFNLEVDLDWTSESNRGDILFTYFPVHIHQGTTWNQGDLGGDGQIQGYADSNNDVGGPAPLSSDYDCGTCDGYTTDFETTAGQFARIISRSGKNIVQLALRASDLGVDVVRVRGWVTQNSSIGKDSWTWHDSYATTDLVSFRIDNSSEVGSANWPEAAVVTPRFVVDTNSDVLDGDTTSIAALLANKGADGFISLREAIIAANRTPNGAAPDTIPFDIGGGGAQLIAPLSALPGIIDAVVLDGSTQPGAVCPAPLIELSGEKLSGSESGIVVAATDVTIRGLAIHSFPQYGVYLQKGSGNTVACTYVGLDAAGVTDRGNGLQGIRIDAGPQLIGGADPADRNVISGNSSGVYLQGTAAADVVIQGNYIGTNAAGDATIPNSIEGVRINGGPRAQIIDNVISGNSTGISIRGHDAVIQGNLLGTDPTGMVDLGNVDGINVGTGLRALIGGTTAAQRNVISGSGDAGIQIGGDSATIVGNYIGVAADGTTPMGNFRGMVLLNGSEGNVIGGTGPNEGNIIAHSLADGVNLYGTTTFANPIRGNSIFLNGGLGIDLDPNGVTPNDLGDADTGPHNLTNFPFFEKAEVNPTAGTLELTGWSRPSTTIDVYIANTDATEFGEGETWLVTLTEGDASDLDASVTAYTHPQAGSDSTSRFRFVIGTPPGVAAGTRLTATAHYSKYGTSEFSLIVKVVETPVQIVSSATDQTFWVGKAPTAASTITVAEGTSPSITAANDIRIRIPAGFAMTWDTLDVAATIGGSAAARVSPTVSYEDAGKTLVLDVTSDFLAVDTVTIADLGFLDFASASGPDNLELEVDNAGTVAAEDDKAIEILAGGTPTISSELDQSFRVGDPPNSISTITVQADATAPTITAANDIRIRIPFGFNMGWDTSDVTAQILGTGSAKVSNTVSYEDGGRTLVIDVLTDFDPGDAITISLLSFANFTAASLDDNLELEVGDDGQVSAYDDKVIFIVLILITPDIQSSRDQFFTVGDPSTPIRAIRVTDDDDIPQMTAANDIRITIPADLDMVWDVTDVTAQIGARASNKVSPIVSYEDGGKTLVIDVITDFVARDWISVRGLSFRSFSSAGSPGRLQLRVYNDATVSSIDTYTKQILGGVFSVDVWPDTTRDSRLPSNGSNYTVDFTVSNLGSTADDYDLLTAASPGTALTVVSISGPAVTQGANPDSARLTNLTASGSAVVTVTYSAGLAPVGTIDTLSFVARSVTSPAQSDDGLLIFTVIRPNITISKVVNPNGTQAPGTDLTYTSTLTNAGTEEAVGVASVSSIAPETQFKVGSVTTSFPAGIVVAVEFSDDDGSTWTYAPTDQGCGAPAGYDGCVTDIRWTLQNPLSSSAPDNVGTMEYVARIE